MSKFFRENIVGLLALSVLGSLIATSLSQVLPTPSAEGLAATVSQPIPVWVVFPYSVLLLLSFAVWALRARHRDQNDKTKERDMLQSRLDEVQRERDSLAERVRQSAVDLAGLEKELEGARTGTVSRPDLMRFVAVVLSSTSRIASEPITHEYVCRHVAGLAGSGVPHAAIGEALAAMLHIGAVESDFRGLFLANSWKAKMREAGVPDAFRPTA